MNQRIGFIGSGFAQEHISALAEVPGNEVVAISSRSSEGIQHLLADGRITHYPFENHLEMLRKEQLDAVYICLPPHLHGDIEIACAEHVKGLFIEKPIALDLATTSRLNDCFKQAGNIVSVGYMYRYRENILKAKEHFASNTSILINAAWSGELPPPYWWRRREQSGGQLTEQATHLIDSIRYLSGEISEVSAYATRGFITEVDDFNVDDAMVMNFHLASGAIGTVQTSCFSHAHGGGELGIYLEMASREKTFRFRNHCMDLEIQHNAQHREKLLSADNPLIAENTAFLQALRNGNHNGIHSTFDDATESLKVSLAADLSIREKRCVAIDSL
ncbi:Gfo/Idh/MocA family protein [Rubritalea marina]|uniref:Gfo/Idh/MocA family protein n=1 Tax=Rubritalea marina TaxID=361055 RepID=UPI0003688E7A|nr:Gfo/Idh/MocA family oxidoreductase [Rubritalea marina]